MDRANCEPFTLIDTEATPSDAVGEHGEHIEHGEHVGDDYNQAFSGRSFDTDLKTRVALRSHYPNHTITVVPPSVINLLAFAFDGNARAVLDTDTEEIIRYRGYFQGFRGTPGSLATSTRFAKYFYTWLTEEYILYNVTIGYYTFQYILHEAAEGEKVTDQSKVTDALIKAIGEWSTPDEKYVYVFDSYSWRASRALYDEVQRSSWKDVILDEKMKDALTDIVRKFYDSMYLS